MAADLTEYVTLLAKVEAFTGPVSTRRSADLTCQAGCSDCCQVWLTVSSVEAEALRRGLAQLDEVARSRVRARGIEQAQREAAVESQRPRCAMLEDDGTCAVYGVRPLVCRTQGHALRYPSGFVPQAAVMARAGSGDVTHCPLNYTERAPAAEDVLDAERVDVILAVVNARFCASEGRDPDGRHALSSLASE
ncbi:MAG TPA: YkgJ family cysteine cluster protein [Polyangiales bacterium]|nr:YkgJ family cysteine cluster protein [Polyangiales bacterium]